MAPITARRVLIVGSGLAGPALALALGRLDAELDLVEIQPELQQPSAGILLAGNALTALDRLGVGRLVRERSHPVLRIRFSDHRGRELFQLEIESQPGWPQFASILRHELQRLLLELASPVRPRCGITVEALAPGRREVRVRFSDGSSRAYDLVVGADGLRSRVRALVFGTPPPAPIEGFSGWRFLTRCPSGLAEPLYMLGNGATLVLCPLAGGRAYCAAGPVAQEALIEGSDDRERLRETFACFDGPARAILDQLDDRIELLPTRYWHFSQAPCHRARCVLIGDAAHACAPTLAQGGALALEDAVVLGELLGEGLELEVTLEAFERRRRARVGAVLRESRARMEANRQIPPARFELRNAVLRAVGARQLAAAWDPLMVERP